MTLPGEYVLTNTEYGPGILRRGCEPPCPVCCSPTLVWPCVDPEPGFPLPEWAVVRGRLCGYCTGSWCCACGLKRQAHDDDGVLFGALCSSCKSVDVPMSTAFVT